MSGNEQTIDFLQNKIGSDPDDLLRVDKFDELDNVVDELVEEVSCGDAIGDLQLSNDDGVSRGISDVFEGNNNRGSVGNGNINGRSNRPQRASAGVGGGNRNSGESSNRNNRGSGSRDNRLLGENATGLHRSTEDDAVDAPLHDST